jgi:hypothetical protein
MIRFTVLASAAMMVLSSSVMAQQRTLVLPKGQVEIDGIATIGTQPFNATATPRINAETATFTADSEIPKAYGFSAGASVTVWRNFAIGGAVSRYRSSSDASLAGSIPHPFAFSTPRAIQGIATGLQRQERSLALQARAVFPIAERVTLTVFGGPVLNSLRQDVVTAMRYTESYPYDVAAFRSHDERSVSKSIWSAGAGADVAYFISRHIGIGLSAKFDGRKLTVPSLYDSTITSRVGGLHLQAGARVRF